MFAKAFITLACALAVSQAHAGAAVYSGSAPALAGNQAFGGMLGLNFTIKSGLFQLTHLGVFDDGANGLSRTIKVGLFERVGSNWVTVAGLALGAGTANVNKEQFIFKSLSGQPIILDAGTYSIQASGYGSGERNFNTNVTGTNNLNGADLTKPIEFNTFGGLLDNLDSVFSNSSTLGGTISEGTFPNCTGTETDCFFRHASAFGAGTLILNQVPEPASLMLMSLGLFGLAATGRRRRTQG